jgi:alanine racemase
VGDRFGAPPVSDWSGRATRAEIDLDALHDNVRVLRSLLPPGTELMAVVKANAYGHGAPVVAAEVLAAGATRLAVATVGEVAALRRGGIGAPVLILGAIDPAEAPAALRLRAEVTVATEPILEAVAGAARAFDDPARVHVKVDTGLGRYGAEPAYARVLARRVAADPYLVLAGAYTHFASADEADDAFTRRQDAAFSAWLRLLAEDGVVPEAAHRANSAGSLGGWAGEREIARCGIAVYGVAPSAETLLPAGMRPVLSLRSRVARVFALRTGDTVGYGRTYRCERGESAALVPVGYADGLSRSLSNRGWMNLGGQRAAVLGRISMDQSVVRTPEGCSVHEGDEVVVFGADPSGVAPAVADIAEQTGTIGYEVLTAIGSRVPRVYRRGGEIVAVHDGLSTEVERIGGPPPSPPNITSLDEALLG